MAWTKKESIGNLTKGSYIVIEDVECKVTDTATSRPGKHGHAKARVTAAGLMDGKKRVFVMPGHDLVDVPVIGKKTAQVLSISENKANVMDSETYETFDIEIPAELKSDVVEGCNILYWQIMDQKVMKQVKSD